MDVFGSTRSRVTHNYALITPDTHVHCSMLDWENTSVVVHISPEIGARFTQFTATMSAGGKSGLPGVTAQRFFYVQEGACSLKLFVEPDKPETHKLSAGGYAYIPAGMGHMIETDADATLVVFEKTFQAHPDYASPTHTIGNAADVAGEPFMGDSDARLQTLIPNSPGNDMAVNIFTYQPGATLPQVEVHVMEHGLLMLAGQGVYRLSDDYHPVTAGDVIWMASYCPQWFVAMGKEPASYIYYKDVNRDRLTEK